MNGGSNLIMTVSAQGFIEGVNLPSVDFNVISDQHKKWNLNCVFVTRGWSLFVYFGD